MKCVLSERSSINVLNSKESYSGGLNHSFISNRTTDDIRYHMGGNGPFIPKVRNIAERGIDPPEGCYVDQVHMVARHAERYPTVDAGHEMLALVNHIRAAKMKLNGSLSFVNQWNFFVDRPEHQFEALVSTGQNAGTLQAFSTGVELRTRYEGLRQQALTRNQTSFWASDSRRVIETAQCFAAGFFGVDWDSISNLLVVPESYARGGDTLTPGKVCKRYISNEDGYGREYGVKMLSEWRAAYLPHIAARLKEENPDISFNEAHVYSMQEMCGFEMIAKGNSRWCDVFTQDEWEQFEYARDLLHYYSTGPGNPYSTTMGWLWLNASAHLLAAGPDEVGPLFFCFVHDEELVQIASALDLFQQVTPLPTSHIFRDRTWRTSDIVPMGGRMIFERLVCTTQTCWDHSQYGYPNHRYCEEPTSRVYVRVNVNDGIVRIPRCANGPGESCAIGEFLERVMRRAKVAGDFRKVCGLSEDAAKSPSFLHH
ncbi:hypothetical protein M433DRAFT_83301 [Acidomyces richmondensis BFW]|nr:MAG: hypothetical protein FE78DRAFT_175544 [Acidomyces sp. 'richmondensis']KYG48799.1 hypothetical protein M433DRAFT_83301 [Acidomyces richmondensis BFW]